MRFDQSKARIYLRRKQTPSWAYSEQVLLRNNGRRFHRTSERNNDSKLMAIDSVWEFQMGERIHWYHWSICKSNLEESNNNNVFSAIIHGMSTERITSCMGGFLQTKKVKNILITPCTVNNNGLWLVLKQLIVVAPQRIVNSAARRWLYWQVDHSNSLSNC